MWVGKMKKLQGSDTKGIPGVCSTAVTPYSLSCVSVISFRWDVSDYCCSSRAASLAW